MTPEWKGYKKTSPWGAEQREAEEYAAKGMTWEIALCETCQHEWIAVHEPETKRWWQCPKCKGGFGVPHPRHKIK